MNSYLIYRASFYLMMTVAAIALCADPSNSRFGWLPPLLVAAAGVTAFLTVDRDPKLSLPQGLAKALALSTLGLLYLEYSLDENELVRSLGHWLIALQLVKYSLPKTALDDWFLFLVGLMQVLIGSVINTGDQVGIWLFVWAILAVWVLGQFFLQREARRFAKAPPTSPGAVLAPSREDPYAGLFDRPYFMATLRVMALTLALGFLAFLLIPRQSGLSPSRFGQTSSQHLTGFDEEVALGQLGEILENETPVMTVEFTDLDRNPIPPPSEPLWRGVTLNSYENGRWRRQTSRSLRLLQIMPNAMLTQHNAFRQAIKLEPNDSPTLFAIRPFLGLRSSRGVPPPSINTIDGTAFRQDLRGTFDYEVISDLDANAPQSGESPPSDNRLEEILLGIAPELKERLRRIAEPLVEGLPTDGPDAILARGRALEGYLLDPRNFGYSLQMSRVDSSMDPVEDFLVNRREGHCEYFASALALLLRSIDIPSRMVNGFKGGDWNDITQTMTVREKHAHSWVEAYAGVNDDGQPIWFVFDPTPGTERERSIAQMGGLAARLRVVTDLVRHVWIFYIQGYNSERQSRLLYEPLGMVARAVRALAVAGWAAISSAAVALFHFKNIRSLISVKGFVVTFLLLLTLVYLAKLCAWLFRRVLAWWRGPDEDAQGATAGILFYRRLAQLLAEYDLERSPAETQNEFARRAFRFLSGRGTGAQDAAESPQKIVDAFYQVRFGHMDLSPETLAELEQRLDALEAVLRPSEGS